MTRLESPSFECESTSELTVMFFFIVSVRFAIVDVVGLLICDRERDADATKMSDRDKM